ncbi:hypothetical protein ACFQ1E_05250 [Sphingomonas canadensis]|uniref:C-type lysozyme inhibitor domain-containing protein n=1 Tax=Sphingomonas canadensis TaxID=1219257 RepID=A0ABW3H336_9SPHN|nr:hypothetical protein [Sphingomonas canadensis]MCW3835804.1 hypothetical protein [Sphingomonas canadensis]
MKSLPLIAAAAAALLSLSACKNEPEVVDSIAKDPLAEQMKNAPKAELPPAVESSVSFRCQPGNKLLYVDFFQGGKMAVLKKEKDGAPTMLNAPEAGQPFVGADGSKITGNAKAATISVAGAAPVTCKA